MISKLHSYRNIALLLVVTAILLLSGLGKLDVNIMEARNFISAREMVQNKEYLLTTLNDQPRYQKPPLPTWLTAVSGMVFGFNSLFAMRLPVVAVTFLLVFSYYLFSKNMGLSESHSLNNALILITSFYIFFSGRDNQWDMYTHSFMFVSIYFLWNLFREEVNGLKNSILAGLFLGFSILSKGPISIYSLFLPFLFSYGLVYKIPFRRKGIYMMTMLLTGLVIGLSWYVYVRLVDSEAFKAMATRETSNWTSYELKPFYYYWSFFLQTGLWAIASITALIYPYLRQRVNNLKAYRFALLWTLFSLILLSIVPEKKVRYLIPVLIPLALTTGFYIDYLMRNFNDGMGKRERRGVYFSFGIFALIGFTFPIALVYLLKDQLHEFLFLVAISSILIYSCSFFIVKGLVHKQFAKVFYSMIAFFTLVVVSLVPLYKEFVYNPDYASTTKVQIFEQLHGIKTYALTSVPPEIVWDFGKPIPIINQTGNHIRLPMEMTFGLMVDQQDTTLIDSLFAGYTIEKVYRINLHFANKKKERLIKNYYIITKKARS